MKLKITNYLMISLFLGLISFSQAQNLIVDPGFENTTNANGFTSVRVNWQDIINPTYTAGGLDTWFTPTVTRVHEGDRSARFYVETPATGTHIRKLQLVTRNWITTSATKFKASVYAFVDDSIYGEDILNSSSGQQFKIMLHVFYADGSSKYPNTTFDLTNDYTQYTFETNDLTDATRGAVTKVKMRFQVGGANGTYWFDEASLEELEVLSLNDNVKNPTITVNPNPTSDFIEINSEVDLEDVSIYNSLGQKVMDIKNTKEKIDVNQLENGIYFIQFNTELSNDVIKFIKN